MRIVCMPLESISDVQLDSLKFHFVFLIEDTISNMKIRAPSQRICSDLILYKIKLDYSWKQNEKKICRLFEKVMSV